MKIFLNGGGSGTKTQETYKEINKIINHTKPVLYVPLARTKQNIHMMNAINGLKMKFLL